MRTVEEIDTDLAKVDGRSVEARALKSERANVLKAQPVTPGSPTLSTAAGTPSPLATLQGLAQATGASPLPDRGLFCLVLIASHFMKHGHGTSYLQGTVAAADAFYDAYCKMVEGGGATSLIEDRDRAMDEAQKANTRAAELHRDLEISRKRISEMENRLLVHMRTI